MKNRWDTLLSVVRLLPFQGRNESVSIRCPVVRRKDATMNELTYRQLKELLPDTPKGKLPTAKELAECEVFLTVSEVADILNICKPYAYNLFAETDFPGMKIGNRYLVRKDKFFSWMENHLKEDADNEKEKGKSQETASRA